MFKLKAKKGLRIWLILIIFFGTLFLLSVGRYNHFGCQRQSKEAVKKEPANNFKPGDKLIINGVQIVLLQRCPIEEGDIWDAVTYDCNLAHVYINDINKIQPANHIVTLSTPGGKQLKVGPYDDGIKREKDVIGPVEGK
jgi:hypothetical protein